MNEMHEIRHEAQMLSVVVPSYNEETVLLETHRRLSAALQALEGLNHEIIYVDDGSGDGTFDILKDLCSEDDHVKVIRFSRNFGHQMAVSAGIEHATGDAVVLIDADLQDPPEVIREMVAQWRKGYKVAYGLRTDRAGETRFKRWSAKVFYRFINLLSAVDIPVDTGDFRLMDRMVVDALLAMPERDRFVRGMISWVGFSQVAVPYRRERRFAGDSKYPFFRMVRFATDGILSFSIVPLRIATFVGFMTVVVAFLGIGYVLFVRLSTDSWVPGWAGLIIAVLFMGGVQLLSLGVIGEYVGRIYGETKQRPIYLVQERLGFDFAKTAMSAELVESQSNAH